MSGSADADQRGQRPKRGLGQRPNKLFADTERSEVASKHRACQTHTPNDIILKNGNKGVRKSWERIGKMIGKSTFV